MKATNDMHNFRPENTALANSKCTQVLRKIHLSLKYEFMIGKIEFQYAELKVTCVPV